MTNKEYISISLKGLNIGADDIELILFKDGLSADDEADTLACDTAIYNRISLVLKAMMQNVSEGGYSVSWNIEAVKAYYSALCSELGKENVLFVRPKIRNLSNIW